MNTRRLNRVVTTAAIFFGLIWLSFVSLTLWGLFELISFLRTLS